MFLIDVIIPSLSLPVHLDMIRNCIASLRASENNIRFNIILVESGPQLIELGQDITIPFDLEKFNFHHALNQGLKVSQSDWVVFANNDLIFYPGWMQAILEAKQLFPQIDSFSPWEPLRHPRYFGNPPYHHVYLGYQTSVTLAGWCIATTKKVLNKIKLSEEIAHWYSDNNYADELQSHGFIHGLVTKSLVHHLEEQTSKRLPNHRELTQGQHDAYLRLKTKGTTKHD